jgi:hypothetical protein
VVRQKEQQQQQKKKKIIEAWKWEGATFPPLTDFILWIFWQWIQCFSRHISLRNRQSKTATYCSPPGLRTFWNFNKNQKTGHFHHYSHPLHNFQPYPQEDVNSETKVMVVSLLHLGKIYQADWKFSVLSSCRFLVVNFRKKFEEELEISRRQNLKGPGDINNLQLQDVQGIHYLIPKVV